MAHPNSINNNIKQTKFDPAVKQSSPKIINKIPTKITATV